MIERVATFVGLIVVLILTTYIGTQLDIRIGLAVYFMFLALWGLVRWRVWRKAWWTNVTSYLSLYMSGFVALLAIPGWNDLATGQVDIISIEGGALAVAAAYVLYSFVQFWLFRRETTKFEADGDNISFEHGAIALVALSFFGLFWLIRRKTTKSNER